MSSDSTIKDQLLSMVNKFTNPLSFRQTVPATTQGDGAVSSVKQSNALRTLSRASTLNLLTGSGEAQSDHTAAHVLSPGNPPAPAQPRSINVVLFGETGVGKSSVINLIARKEVAKVSSDVNGCTMQSTRYDITFDNMDFSIFDTIGLEEPQMGVNGYLKAIEKAYELIVRLGAAGGIHLLLFCMRGGRITATTQSNYRLFCECLCSTKVPIALVFTGLERETKMEDWWERNKGHIEHYGIKSNGHACITAVQDETPEDHKYAESQTIIRELLKKCALKHEAFLPEQHSWFARLGRGMRSFIEKHRSPKRKDVVRVLTRRCKLDPETARKIADLMTGGDAEKPKNAEAEGESDPVAKKDEDESAQKHMPEVEPHTDSLEGRDEVGTATEVAESPLALSENNIEAEPRTIVPERKDESGVTGQKAKRRTLAPPQNDAEPAPRTVGPEGEDKSGVTNDSKAARHQTPELLQNDAEAGPRTVGLREGYEKGAKLRILANSQSDVGLEPRTIGLQGREVKHPKTSKSGREQSPDMGLAEQVKLQRGDSISRPQQRVPSTTVRSSATRRAIYISP